jgi:ABC-type transport system substrate-binding protein
MKRFLLVMVLVLAAAAFAFAGGESEPESQGGSMSSDGTQMGGVLVFARSGDSVGLDPGRETDGESFYGSRQIFDTLVEFKPGTTEVQPALAESWEISDNGLEFTFNLRPGVTFHDGTDFNADAVKFSFDRQRLEDHPYYDHGPWKYFGGMGMGSIIDDIVVVDDLTVKFVLTAPEAPFVANLAMDFAAIVSPAAVALYDEEFSSNPVGTGPFKLVSWTKDDSIVLEANKDYWGEGPYLDRLILRVIPDATARYLALKNGEVDVIDFPSAEDLELMDEDPNIELIQQPGLNVGYIAMNVNKEPFGDVRVRQAMNYAINREEIIEGVYGSAGQVANNPIPPTIWSYNDDIEPYPYDPEKARELLAEAGYPNGFSTDLWAMPVARPYNPNARRIAEIVQAQLAEIGVDIEIVSYDWGTYLDKTDGSGSDTGTGEHSMAMLGWTGDNGDPDNFIYLLLSADSAAVPAMNISFWRNQEFTDLTLQAKRVYDQDARAELYKQAQVIFHEEAPWVPIAHSVVTVPVRSNVKDFVIYPTGSRVFQRVWLDQ